MRMWWLALASLLLLAACGAQPVPSALSPASSAVATIGVADLKAQLDRQETMLLLDVRSAEEYAGDGGKLVLQVGCGCAQRPAWLEAGATCSRKRESRAWRISAGGCPKPDAGFVDRDIHRA